MKKAYAVEFNIPHYYEVVAENEEEAYEKAQEMLEFDVAQMDVWSADGEVEEMKAKVCPKCEEIEDDDGRCDCIKQV